jgi:secreted PhoX family phosphatase
VRNERHGYVFEVAANADGLVDAIPLREMGRFEHEAAAVHERSGIVYMTEDRYHSLFYRFLPNAPGNLREGGQLQALGIKGRPSHRSHNWGVTPDIRLGEAMPAYWIDLGNVDPAENDLRSRGAALGAAMFARGEGLTAAGDDLFFTCTIGGRARLGQVFRYTPGPLEGEASESKEPGTLQLIAEASADSLLRNADNLTMAPWGDLIVCEDTSNHCGLVGIRADGSQYELADNPYSNSELAGVCFSPDGKTLFVNIQYPGMTLAITGPWPSAPPES